MALAVAKGSLGQVWEGRFVGAASGCSHASI